jgi:hypothetical protein
MANSFIKKNKKLNLNNKVKELNNTIIEIYKKGGNTFDVEKYLKSIGREKSSRIDIYLANAQIKEEAKLERDSLILVHTKRYEELFNNHFNKTIGSFVHLQPNIAKFMLVDSYIIAMDALIAKEKVLGLHTKRFRLQLNNFFKKKIVSQYNFSQQEFKDLVRLNELLLKMRSDEAPIYNFENDVIDDANNTILDVGHIIVNDQVSNKIKEEINIKQDITNDKSSLENITDKILKEDLKNNDKKRNSFLDKLKKI